MEFRTQYSDPLPYKFEPDQDVEVDGFQPNGVESVGQMVARLKAGGTAPFFEAVGDLGLGQFIDEFDLMDALQQSGTDRSAAADSPDLSVSGDRKSDIENKNGAAGETPPPATGE